MLDIDKTRRHQFLIYYYDGAILPYKIAKVYYETAFKNDSLKACIDTLVPELLSTYKDGYFPKQNISKGRENEMNTAHAILCLGLIDKHKYKQYIKSGLTYLLQQLPHIEPNKNLIYWSVADSNCYWKSAYVPVAAIIECIDKFSDLL